MLNHELVKLYNVPMDVISNFFITHAFIEGLEENDGEAISMNRSFGVAVLNTLWIILSGVRYEQDDPRLWSIIKGNEE